MTGEPTTLSLRPNVEAAFQALRENLTPQRHIRWQEVYNLRAHEFDAHPLIRDKIMQALHAIENHPSGAGQRLFRDMVNHPTRTARIDIGAPQNAAQQRKYLAYSWPEDKIIVNAAHMADSELVLARGFRVKIPDLQNQLFVMLAHESDHAANIPADILYQPESALSGDRRAALVPCLEGKAVQREVDFRQQAGVAPRPLYVDHTDILNYYSHQLGRARGYNDTKAEASLVKTLSEFDVPQYAREQVLANVGCTIKLPAQIEAEVSEAAATLQASLDAIRDRHGLREAQLSGESRGPSHTR